ncbi:MAG: 50S ribosomal protein L4 [Nanoarchaeota archaeon]|nr:50S ribosomal protein L4 [Nanoarchaeota archaeon]
MKLNILSLKKAELKKADMPKQFSEPVRQDIINRAVKAIESRARQPYGSSPRAGMRHSAFVSKRRHKYKTTYGIGQSRTPRKVMSSRGTRFNWVGAEVPQTVGGRRAHPPKAEKIWEQKLNKKENRKAIRSALSATVVKAIVEKRGHKVPDNYPFIIESKIEAISKTKEAIALLETLGMVPDLERSSVKKIRAGKGKARGRKYKTRIGPLLVVADEECAAMQSFANIQGVDVEVVHNLNAQLLAPGSIPGRLTIFSETAIARIEKENLFTDAVKLAGVKDIAEEKEAEEKEAEKKESKRAEEEKKPRAEVKSEPKAKPPVKPKTKPAIKETKKKD